MYYKSVFISDLHLGTKYANSEKLLEFLRKIKCDNLFLVGDVIDARAMKRKFRWNNVHTKVINNIFKKAENWVNVFFIVGNHDDFLRNFIPFEISDSIKVLDRCDYVWIDNNKYLVLHWDFFDWFIATTKWIPKIWSYGYEILLRINFWITKIAKILKIQKNINVSKYIKNKVKKTLNFINDFENVLSKYAKEEKYDWIICWHIHKLEIRTIDWIRYLNCWDWMESCTAIVEKKDWTWDKIQFLK